MVASFTLSTSHAVEALWRILTWPARVTAARRTMSELARMSEYELRDIGLTRSDLNDATALLIYRAAVAAAGASFSLIENAPILLLAAIGSVAAFWFIGRLAGFAS